MYAVSSGPTQFLGILVNLLADLIPSAQSEWRPTTGIVRTDMIDNPGEENDP